MTSLSTASSPLLIVEDDPMASMLERTILEKAGFQVDVVETGKQALKYLADRESPALLVLDYFLPDMTGGDVVAALGDQIADLPVVMVTGHPDPAITKQLLAAGVIDYIIKDEKIKFLDRLLKVARAIVG